MNVKWYSTTEKAPFQIQEFKQVIEADTFVKWNGIKDQVITGFGGCFNELGWVALADLTKDKADEVLDLLFDSTTDGLKFNFCRMPIGASDYATKWYSHNECEGDLEMEHFSIQRDYTYLLPYIKEAYKRLPSMKIFASPWSPPTWLKFPQAYNFGTLIWTPENLQAYALYFAKFVQAYEKEGIKIDQIHVQNEPMSSQKFPSCKWTGEQFAEFIGKYLGPCFEDNGINSEIWLGTLNGPEPNFFDNNMTTGYNDYANLVLHNLEASKYVRGVGYQWAGKNAIQQTHESWPEIGLMQTENECGEGKNTWEYARYVFGLFRHYLTNGANAYVYWNMVLHEGGDSTWGWKQNSLVTILPGKNEYVLNPEYYVMKHFSKFIKPGAVRLGLSGHFASNSVVVENPDGEIVFVTFNPFKESKTVELTVANQSYSFTLKADSINTMVIQK